MIENSLQKKILNFIFGLTIIFIPLNNISIPWPIDSFNLSTSTSILYCAIYFLAYPQKIIKSAFVIRLYIILLLFLCASLLMTTYFYLFKENIVNFKNREMIIQTFKSFLSFSLVVLHILFAFLSKDRININRLIKLINISNVLFMTYTLFEILIYFNILQNANINKIMQFLNFGFRSNFFIISGGRIHGLLYEPSVASALIVLTYIPINFMVLFFKMENRRFAQVLLILNVFFVILCRSRTGIVTFGIMVVTYFIYSAYFKRWKTIIFVVFFFIFAGLVFKDNIEEQAIKIVSHLSTVINPAAEQSANTRWGLIKSGIEVFLDYPLLGVGSGNFGFIGPSYAKEKVVYSELDNILKGNIGYWLHPFSFLIKYICEFGMLGLTILLFVTVYIFKKCISGSYILFIYLCFIIPSLVVISFSTPVYHNFYYFVPLLVGQRLLFKKVTNLNELDD